MQIQRQSFAVDEALEEACRGQDKSLAYEQILGLASKFPKETVQSEYVVVTKNPCSHPGDIRLLKPVGEDDPRWEQLSEYFNVIVFPAAGYRPEQHKMSGGDLDGDCFMVIWDEDILSKMHPDMIKPPAVYKKYEDDSKLESNRIEDHIKRYFEKDNLGHLSNVHLALCDQLGATGPYDPDCVELSRLISVAVDFAKHGKCVSRGSYEHIEERLSQWPDFMEAGNPKKEVLESPHILGRLYRGVDCKRYFKKCIEGDHRRSVALDYKLNQAVLGAGRGSVPEWHEHLKVAFEEITVPMTVELKRLMVTFKIMNEGELFCTNLNFNLDDDRHQKLIGDPGTKDEDAVKQLNTKLQLIIAEYRQKFYALAELRKYHRVMFARALYFSCYYNKRNDDYNSYVGRFFLADSRRDIDKFEALWLTHHRETLGFELDFWVRLQDLKFYKKTLKKGRAGSDEKI